MSNYKTGTNHPPRSEATGPLDLEGPNAVVLFLEILALEFGLWIYNRCYFSYDYCLETKS